MEKFKYIIPEESQDAIMGNVKTLRKIENKLRGVFEDYEYNEVLMPSFEYADLYSGIATGVDVERLFQFFNKEGKAVALRADFTFPLARLHATRVTDEIARYSYFGKVYRKEQRHKGRSSEIFQAGIELIGQGLNEGDNECLEIISKCVPELKIKEVKIEIGNSAFYYRLVTILDDKNNELAEILKKKDLSKMKKFINEKVTLGVIDENDAVFFNNLPFMFGGKEVFMQAKPYLKDQILKDILNHLEKIYDDFSNKIVDLTVDLSMVPKFNYYTGLMIQGYSNCVSEPIISGGRYDNLLGEFGNDSKAIGISFNLNRILEIVESEGAI